jgi:hypothetical protein
MTVRSGRDHGPYHTGEEKRESFILIRAIVLWLSLKTL